MIEIIGTMRGTTGMVGTFEWITKVIGTSEAILYFIGACKAIEDHRNLHSAWLAPLMRSQGS
jgi:hypothetical protein